MSKDCSNNCPRSSFQLKSVITYKTLVIIFCFTTLYTFFLYNTKTSKVSSEKIPETLLSFHHYEVKYKDNYSVKKKSLKNLKYILLWTPADFAPFYFYGKGQDAFIKNKCPHVNCYVTSDRGFLDNDVTKFDAIAFNGRNLNGLAKPVKRSPHQRYIYFNMESSDNHPVCDAKFDGFFNWTSTYKLDSDIPIPYLEVRNKDNNVIGPKIDMQWIDMGANTIFDKDLYSNYFNKTKAAAWFVSSCSSRSKRFEVANSLQKAMFPYNMELYIYGKCGKLECPRDKHKDCLKMLEKDFHFYLSFENSFSEDYVTEKVLTAIQHDTIPIVYGGANYSRFLPPGSYLDATKQTPDELAATMYSIMQSPRQFLQFFQWKKYYAYNNPIKDHESVHACSLCEALNNNERMMTKSVYNNLRKWWHPNFEERCKR